MNQTEVIAPTGKPFAENPNSWIRPLLLGNLLGRVSIAAFSFRVVALPADLASLVVSCDRCLLRESLHPPPLVASEGGAKASEKRAKLTLPFNPRAL